MIKDLISVLMPVKNGQKYLKECILSIKNQSIDNWELIVVNDHSNDNSVRIIQDFSESDSRIQLIKNSGQGIANALEKAYELANGEFISRMDCDDLMHRNKLEKLQVLLKECGREHVVTSLVSYFSETNLGAGYKAYEKWLNNVLVDNKIFEEIYRECTIPSPSWMTYKEDMDQFDIMKNLGLPEDYEMAFRFYKYGFRPIVMKEKLHLWRDHSERISRNSADYDIRSFGAFKIKKFLELELQKDDDLVLWGCGNKGKELAKILVKKTIEFTWVTENENKIGHVIYSKKIHSKESIVNLRQPKVVISVSNKNDQLDIKNYLDLHFEVNYLQYFFFF